MQADLPTSLTAQLRPADVVGEHQQLVHELDDHHWGDCGWLIGARERAGAGQRMDLADMTAVLDWDRVYEFSGPCTDVRRRAGGRGTIRCGNRLNTPESPSKSAYRIVVVCDTICGQALTGTEGSALAGMVGRASRKTCPALRS